MTLLGHPWSTFPPSFHRIHTNTSNQISTTKKFILITLFSILSILTILSSSSFQGVTAASEYSSSIITPSLTNDNSQPSMWHANWIDQNYSLKSMANVWVVIRFDFLDSSFQFDRDLTYLTAISTINVKFYVMDLLTSSYMYVERQQGGKLTPDDIISLGIPDSDNKNNIYFSFPKLIPYSFDNTPFYNLEINFGSLDFNNLIPLLNTTMRTPGSSPITIDIIGLTLDPSETRVIQEYQRLGRSRSQNLFLNETVSHFFNVEFTTKHLLDMNESPILHRKMAVPVPPPYLLVDKPWYRRHWAVPFSSGARDVLDFSSFELSIAFPRVIYEYFIAKTSNGGSIPYYSMNEDDNQSQNFNNFIHQNDDQDDYDDYAQNDSNFTHQSVGDNQINDQSDYDANYPQNDNNNHNSQKSQKDNILKKFNSKFSQTQFQQELHLQQQSEPSQLFLEITGFGNGFISYYSNTQSLTSTCFINDYPSVPTSPIQYSSQTSYFPIPIPLLNDLLIKPPSFLTIKCPEFFLPFQFNKNTLDISIRLNTTIRMDIREVVVGVPSIENSEKYENTLLGSVMFRDEIHDTNNNQVLVPFSISIHRPIVSGITIVPSQVEKLPFPALPSIFFHKKKNLITSHCQFSLSYRLNGIGDYSANTSQQRDPLDPYGTVGSENLWKKYQDYYNLNAMSLHLSFPLMDIINHDIDITISSRLFGNSIQEIELLNYTDYESRKKHSFKSFKLTPNNWLYINDTIPISPAFQGQLGSMFTSSHSTILGITFTGYVDPEKWNKNESLCQVFLGFHPQTMRSNEFITRPAVLTLESSIPPKIIGEGTLGKENKVEFISLNKQILSFEVNLEKMSSGPERIESTKNFSISLSHGKWQFHTNTTSDLLLIYYRIQCFDLNNTIITRDCEIIKIRIENHSKIFFEIKKQESVRRFIIIPPSDPDLSIRIVSTTQNNVLENFQLRPDGPFLEGLFNGALLEKLPQQHPNWYLPQMTVEPSYIDFFSPDLKGSNLILTLTLYESSTDTSSFEIQGGNIEKSDDNNDGDDEKSGRDMNNSQTNPNNKQNHQSTLSTTSISNFVHKDNLKPLASFVSSTLSDPSIQNSVSVSFHPDDPFTTERISSRSGILPSSSSSESSSKASTTAISIIIPIIIIILIIILIIIIRKFCGAKNNKKNQNDTKTTTTTNNQPGETEKPSIQNGGTTEINSTSMGQDQGQKNYQEQYQQQYQQQYQHQQQQYQQQQVDKKGEKKIEKLPKSQDTGGQMMMMKTNTNNANGTNFRNGTEMTETTTHHPSSLSPHQQQYYQQSPSQQQQQQYSPGYAYPSHQQLHQHQPQEQPDAPPLVLDNNNPTHSYPIPRQEYQQDIIKEDAPPAYDAVYEI